MTGWLIFPAAVTAVAFAMALALSLGVERIVRAVARFEPASRARLLGLACLLPTLAAVVITAMGFVPTLLFDLGFVHDWCLTRQPADHLACPMHPHTVGIGNAALMLALAAAGVVAGAFAHAMAQLMRARRVLARLDALAEPGAAGVVRVVRSECAVALSTT